MPQRVTQRATVTADGRQPLTLWSRFEGISGRIDQGAGILFNLKPNGDYLTIRANPLENNLVLWKFEKGKRSSVTWIRNTPTTTPLALIQTRPKTFRSQAGFGFSSWPLFR